jgi:hypothetical protein
MPYLADLIMMMDQMITQMLQYSPQIYSSNQLRSLVYSPTQRPYQTSMSELRLINYASLNCSNGGQILTQSNKKNNYSGTAKDW